jgi:hypothetical protein
MGGDAYPKIFAALVGAALLSACAEAPTRDALRAYVTSADQWIDHCAKLRRTPEKTSERREAVCVREAQEMVKPLYLAAAASVRSQRGTTMYLERYQAQWNAAMTALGHSAPTDERPQTSEEQRKMLRGIAAKLTDG